MGPGAWTGEIPNKMLSDMGIGWVVADKTKFAVDGGLSTLTCIGEKLEAREAGTPFDVLDEQMKPLAATLTEDDWEKVVLAYEPVWAIGTGKVARLIRQRRCMPTCASGSRTMSLKRSATRCASSMAAL